MKSTIVKTVFLIISVKFLVATVAAQSSTMSSSAGIEVKMNRKDGQIFSVELSGNGPQYIALGLSKDSSMGGDAVIVCTGSDVQTYVNPPGSHIPAQKQNWPTGTPSNSKSSISNGKISCSFDLPSSIDAGSGITFNLNTIDDLHVLVAQGQTSDSGIAPHEHTNGGRSAGLIQIERAAASGPAPAASPDSSTAPTSAPASGPAPTSAPAPASGTAPASSPVPTTTQAPGTTGTSSNLKPMVVLYSVLLYCIVL